LLQAQTAISGALDCHSAPPASGRLSFGAGRVRDNARGASSLQSIGLICRSQPRRKSSSCVDVVVAGWRGEVGEVLLVRRAVARSVSVSERWRMAGQLAALRCKRQSATLARPLMSRDGFDRRLCYGCVASDFVCVYSVAHRYRDIEWLMLLKEVE
jgi:hypothetical protein